VIIENSLPPPGACLPHDDSGTIFASPLESFACCPAGVLRVFSTPTSKARELDQTRIFFFYFI